MPITDADRDAANALRAVLADISGFWHKPGDDGPLCLALARHREAAEAALAAKIAPIVVPRPAPAHDCEIGRMSRAAPVTRLHGRRQAAE